MKLGKFKITNKGLYWGLIITFALLYMCVGFVSTLHSITFFHLANTMSLAVLLGLTYEVGQASVLFSILMSEKNQGKFLPWLLMILLTALQVTANVYASFKYMVQSGTNDWVFWQKSILFGVQSANPEIYQMIISWISGALLPIVALGMTALVAQNMKFMNEENEEHPEKPKDEGENKVKEFLNHEFIDPNTSVSKEYVDGIKKEEPIIAPDREEQLEILKDAILSNKESSTYMDEEVARLTPDVRNPLNKYEDKFGPEFTKTMKEIHDEIAAEEAIQEINDSINKTTAKTDEEIIESFPKFSPVSSQNLPQFELVEKNLEKEIKKRGRPPKQKDNVAESKKEQELLQKEVVKVPQRKKRVVNPLKRKEKKIKPLKNLKEINKPSKGDEVIALLEKMEKEKQKESIIPSITDVENAQNALLVPPELKDDYASYIMDGVEVIDAKAIPVKKNLT
jgi:hypothetical protein